MYVHIDMYKHILWGTGGVDGDDEVCVCMNELQLRLVFVSITPRA